jgi:plasmid stabilization system protein ParE
LKAIALFIAKDSKLYAQQQVLKLRNETSILKRHPRAGKKVMEWNDDNVREIVAEPYRIIYRIVDDQGIDILTIHHTARLLEK